MRKKLKQREYIKKKMEKSRTIQRDCYFDTYLVRNAQGIRMEKAVVKYESAVKK